MSNYAFSAEHVTITPECPRSGVLAQATLQLPPGYPLYRYLVLARGRKEIVIFAESEGAEHCEDIFPEISDAIKRAVLAAFLDHGDEPRVAPVPRPTKPPVLHARAAKPSPNTRAT